MQHKTAISNYDYHDLFFPSSRIKRRLLVGLYGITITVVAAYGLQSYTRVSSPANVATNVEPKLPPILQIKQVPTNELAEAKLRIKQLEEALITTQELNSTVTSDAAELRVQNGQLSRTVNDFQSGAIYLKDKYNDFAYAFNLDDAKVVPLSKGIASGKVQLSAIYAMSQDIPFGTVFDRPYRISSLYGVRNIKGHPNASKNHKGIDFPVLTGTAIYAPADGYAEVVRPSKSKTGSGNFLRLQHAFGFESSYSHLSKFAIANGEYVQKGDLIGYSGNTGYTTGPHLHYEIKYRGRHIDPKPLFSHKPGSGITLLRGTSKVDWDGLLAIYKDNALMNAVIFRP
ncbi:M23 family metallopeptidase [Vibrio sp. Makdt]|uniref:M23 family metallopeptidase n=1 Tax=Vibrio sp. Makdt TaxID=2998828 RepID=UPI0022CD8C21|nr:M23 family metallopeptidase [Vibrio sp. Makdt]MDA0152324.1 M23 family metallopeptidase [Vibrio sp. Makdt]